MTYKLTITPWQELIDQAREGDEAVKKLKEAEKGMLFFRQYLAINSPSLLNGISLTHANLNLQLMYSTYLIKSLRICSVRERLINHCVLLVTL